MSNNVPEIRFKGFTHAWEQRKLGEVYGNIRNAFVGTATPYYVECKEDGYFYLESNNIKEGQINRNAEVFINEAFYQGQRDRWLHTGDLVMVQSGHVGHTAVIPEELDCVAAHALIMFQNSIDNLNPYFINYQLQTLKSKKKLDYITTGNTIKHILASEMKQFTVDFSDNIEEQTAISNFFRTLDDTITLHKRKLGALKELKQGYLQQMFPKVGERVPQVRFAGFTEDWTMCKLGDVVERIKRKNKGLESTLALTISAQYGLLAQKDFFEQEVASKDVSNYYLVKNGEFAYNKSYSNGYPWGAVKRLENYEMGVLSTLYIVFKPISIDSEFLAQYYETTHWHNEVAQYAAEGARNHGLLNIATSDFFDTMLTIPTNSNEQAIIGNFFLMLDGQIMAQDQKLSQLKQLKSAYLQKMLV